MSNKILAWFQLPLLALVAGGAMIAVGCGGGDGGDGDGSGIDRVDEFVGEWFFTSGSSTFTCGSDEPIEQDLAGPDFVIEFLVGEDSDLQSVERASGIPSCTWNYLVEGDAAILDGEQTCIGDFGSTTLTSDIFTLSADGTRITDVFAGSNEDVDGAGCNYSGQGTLELVP
jgi:hypothetical protein